MQRLRIAVQASLTVLLELLFYCPVFEGRMCPDFESKTFASRRQGSTKQIQSAFGNKVEHSQSGARRTSCLYPIILLLPSAPWLLVDKSNTRREVP